MKIQKTASQLGNYCKQFVAGYS